MEEGLTKRILIEWGIINLPADSKDLREGKGHPFW